MSGMPLRGWIWVSMGWQYNMEKEGYEYFYSIAHFRIAGCRNRLDTPD